MIKAILAASLIFAFAALAQESAPAASVEQPKKSKSKKAVKAKTQMINKKITKEKAKELCINENPTLKEDMKGLLKECIHAKMNSKK